MRAGLLTETIQIQKPVTTETQYSGGETDYEDYITTRAQVIHSGNGRRTSESEIIANVYTVKFIIRIYHKVKYGMIVMHEGIRYHILDINPEKVKQCITITAEVWNE